MPLRKRCDCPDHNKCRHHWRARFEVAGREVERSTRAAGRREAKIQEARFRAQFGAPPPGQRATGRVTLADLGGWDVARAAAKGAGEGQQATLEYIWGRITDHWGPDTDPRKVYSHREVQSYVVARRKAGALGQTIKREVFALKRAEREAQRRGAVLYPMSDWPQVESDPVGTARKGRLHPPAILATWLAQLPQEARDQAELALLTGLRRGDLLAIEAGWIEPAEASWGVPAILRMPPRGKRRRRELVVPLVPRAFEILKRRVGQTPADTPLVPQGDYRKAWAAARKAIGYQTPISLRDLRHTWGTLAGRSVGADAARDGLGHSNISTTSRYLSGDIGRIAAASTALAEQLAEAKTGTPPGTPTPEKGCEELQVFDLLERATGLEPATLSLGSQPHDLARILNHVVACNYCRKRVLACANLTVVDGKTGTVNRDSDLAS